MRFTVVSVPNRTPYRFRRRLAARTASQLDSPFLVRRYRSCRCLGPSALNPTRNRFCARNAHQASLSSEPFVWRSFDTRRPDGVYLACSETTFLKKSRPSKVGSPPCHVKAISSASWLRKIGRAHVCSSHITISYAV